MKLQLLFSMVILHSATSIYRDATTLSPNENETTYITNSTDPTAISPEPTYDYLVVVSFNLDESKIPAHILNVIYDQASEKSITTDDVASLYGLKTISRNTTLDFLEQLDLQAENLFSLDGFDKFLTELNIDFKEFYNRVLINRLNLTGNPLRDVLQTLQINVNNFSMGMAYGDPNPYDEFKKGNYSYETVNLALGKANRTFDELFEACRDEFVTKALSYTPKVVLNSLLKYGFDKAIALKLWNILELNMTQVYSIPSLRNLINEADKELNQVPFLGVLTTYNGVSINKEVYDSWEKEKTIARPKAESITGSFFLQISDEVLTELESIVTLRVAAVEVYSNVSVNITSIEYGKAGGSIKDCKFVTLENDTVIVSDVDEAKLDKTDITIPRGNVSDVIRGSPLICDDKVYGLAREISGDDIVFDSFGSSSAIHVYLNNYAFSLAVAICLFVQFL